MDDIRWAIAQEIPHLRRYARSLTGDVARADDLVQASLERALRKHRLWLRRGSLRNWLFRIVYRTFLNERGCERAHLDVAALHDSEAALALPAAQEDRLEAQDMLRALQWLPVGQRAALVLVVVEELSYEEAAAVLAVARGTVRSRLSRARENQRAWCAEPATATTRQPPHLRRIK